MDKAIELLESQYRELTEAHGAATVRSDFRAANKSHDRLISLVPKIRAHGAEGEAALMRLMNDTSDSVACWAATHCLPFAETAALERLGELAKTPGLIGLDAKMAVQLWGSGELVIP